MNKLIVRPDILTPGRDVVVTFVDEDRSVYASITVSVTNGESVETITLKLRKGVGAAHWTVPAAWGQAVFTAPGCEDVTRGVE